MLFRRRHVFVLMTIGAREDKARQILAGKLVAQRGQPRRHGCRICVVIERLKTGLRHPANLWMRRDSGNGGGLHRCHAR
jgi:hypothetical protein